MVWCMAASGAHCDKTAATQASTCAAYALCLDQVTKVSVPDDGLFYMHVPDPDWRNEADCGTADYRRSDGSTLPLNCAGPKHAYFR